MEFWSLLMVASRPVLQVLLVGLIGAFLASGYVNILSSNARRDVNKIVFVVFIPALVFASLAKTVTAKDIISWWFMPVNIGITFLIGGILGWAAVKMLKLEHHLRALVIASCSAGNLGAMPLIIVPAICDEDGNPFGLSKICRVQGISYASFSMVVGNLFIWTHTYSLIRKSVSHSSGNHGHDVLTRMNKNPETNRKTRMFDAQEEQDYDDRRALLLPPSDTSDRTAEHQSETEGQLLGRNLSDIIMHIWEKLKGTFHKMSEELLSPPTISAIIGFAVGAIPWLKAFIVGETAPLKVVHDSMTLLGDGTIPCTIIILGGNLTEGLRKSTVKPLVIVAIICVRYVILPLSGIVVVMAAGRLGFLPQSPLYSFILLIQYTVPPAMSIGTMAQLFDACQEECSVIFLWTYLVAAFAVTIWSVVFMWILL
ncbi:protein PIN-LIKES 7 [Musa acuminata AAA Group]|uniref:protein PIN-LIKES 7 n=1 Tax=Musa acuminata AAA Group TaxID=214697 RepID=UPI0031D9CCF6